MNDTPDLTPADLAALGRVWEEYRPRLLVFVAWRLDPALAARYDPEDVLQDAFLIAARRWPHARHDADPSARKVWVYGLVLGRLVEVARAARRKGRGAVADLPLPARSSVQMLLDLVSPATDPLDAAVRAEQGRRVRETLGDLTDDDREVLGLRAGGALSYAEIGRLLGVEENTATKRYHRALLRLREAWRRAGGHSGEPS